ncbi:hypothetical protein [Actomonas aquatica]|uniref:Uncharacterized protein n=1 Tax=Actomonas aquatica TaxID=2866162 RepID=A0ABZ1CBY5_9BACT|nr:hypothetical protein [Opitutus sp. WL0086]WRQ88089.1 hypothetical protein K1X11_001635 [Opitutus sp. WL0086]
MISLSAHTSRPDSRPARPQRAATAAVVLISLLALAALLLVALVSYRQHNQTELVRQEALLAQTALQAAEQELAMERVISQRLAQDSVDLGEARLALLSPADAATAPSFAVIWSPTSGEGVLLYISNKPLPVDVRFTLTATRRPSSDRFVQDQVFAAAPPAEFVRGLFTFQPEEPATVTAFTLELATDAPSATVHRFGGSLQP